jgi:hypothetical protein
MIGAFLHTKIIYFHNTILHNLSEMPIFIWILINDLNINFWAEFTFFICYSKLETTSSE